jgi:hypothetical protein
MLITPSVSEPLKTCSIQMTQPYETPFIRVLLFSFYYYSIIIFKKVDMLQSTDADECLH